MNNKVAIYCRLSEEDRNKKSKNDDSGSIQNQKLMLTEYAFDHHWEIYKIYSDDDYTGSDRNRPAFKQMIEDAKSRKFDIVLCKTQSRFTRELEVVEAYIHNLFPLLGIRFVSIVDNIDTDVAGNKKTRQINGLINEWYLEDMSDSIKAALRTRMKAGFFIGSFPPYGYQKDPMQKGHLIIDEEAAEVVRMIFELYVGGMGRTSIARLLNERGIPSPGEYYRLHQIKHNVPGKASVGYWKYYSVSHILENEVYIGNLVQGRTYHPTYKTKHSIPSKKSNWIICKNTHEPIIDMDTWNMTRELWDRKSKPCYKGDVNLFSGKLVCAKCGYNMGTAYNKHIRYYRCSNAKYGRNCCTGTSIFEKTLEKAILNEIGLLKDRYLNTCEVLDATSTIDDSQKQISGIEKSITTLKNKMSEITTALKSLYIDKLKGIVTEAQFTELTVAFEQERDDYERKLISLQEELDERNSFSASREDQKQFIEKLISFDHVSRELVNSFIKRIEIDGNKHDRVVNIFWKF